MIGFLTLTMLPIVTAYKDELNRRIARKEEFIANIDSNSRWIASCELTHDTGECEFQGDSIGYKLINEARAEKGEPGLEWGDKPLVSKDLVPLDYLMDNPTLKERRKMNKILKMMALSKKSINLENDIEADK